MLITSATRGPVVSAETAAFAERRLLDELERRRRLIEMRAELEAGRPTQLVVHEPLRRRLLRAVRALRAARAVDRVVCEEMRLSTPAHR